MENIHAEDDELIASLRRKVKALEENYERLLAVALVADEEMAYECQRLPDQLERAAPFADAHHEMRKVLYDIAHDRLFPKKEPAHGRCHG